MAALAISWLRLFNKAAFVRRRSLKLVARVRVYSTHNGASDLAAFR